MAVQRRFVVVNREGSNRLRKNSMSKAYNAYCRAKGIKKKDKIGKDDLEDVMYKICKTLSEHMIKKDGGVHIKQLGYFCVYIAEVPMYSRAQKTKEIRRNRGGGVIITRPHFTAAGGDKELSFWTMSYTINKRIKRIVRSNFRRGKLYKAYPFTMRKLLRLSQADSWEPQILKLKADE
jgi:hypothetical protein